MKSVSGSWRRCCPLSYLTKNCLFCQKWFYFNAFLCYFKVFLSKTSQKVPFFLLFRILTWNFKLYSDNAFETAEFWCIVCLTMHLLQRKGKTPPFFICSFYCCLSESRKRVEPWMKVALAIWYPRASCL